MKIVGRLKTVASILSIPLCHAVIITFGCLCDTKRRWICVDLEAVAQWLVVWRQIAPKL